MVISARSRGGDARTHNLPLTEIYKGIFAQVPAYTGFYKSENFCVYAKSSFCAYVHFKDEIYGEFYKWGPWSQYF